MSKSSKTSKKKRPTKPKPKQKTGAKVKKTTKKAPTKKKTPAKKTGKKTPTKKATSRKEKKPPKKKTRRAPQKKTVSSDIAAMLKELEIEIQSADEQVSLGAIERLGLLDHSLATQILIGAMSDPRYMIRIHVAAQLGERQDKKSVDALIASLSDESIFVRQTIAGALENIGGAKAKKAVTQAEKKGILLDDLPEGRRLTKQ